LNTQNNFYTFLNLAGIFQKGKIDLLKKKSGPGWWTLARPAQICGLLGPGAAEPVRRRPIQIGRCAAFFLARYRMQARRRRRARVSGAGKLTEGAVVVVGV
jgi:hypothetical protein